MWIGYNSNNIVTVASSTPVEVDGLSVLKIKSKKTIKEILGKPLSCALPVLEDSVTKSFSELRVAMVCNWQTQCGISTYSKFLSEALGKQVKEVAIFSEVSDITTGEDGPEVTRCWKRGDSLLPLATKIKAYNPDFIIIQHEFGIFPNMFYFMQLMQQIDHIPYVVTLHSVYKHLDKIVYSSTIKNLVVHTEAGKKILLDNGHNSNISVVPHGCIHLDDVKEIYNNTFNPYCVIQFGFGFAYKGVERALDAIYKLKTTDKKFERIFYMYLLSENEHTANAHNDYYNRLMDKVKMRGLDSNVAIIRKYQPDHILNLYLRLAKLAVFPYINNPNNTVYAASGAVRIAMANKIPVIASESHLFDDLEGILPRPSNSDDLARTIDELFSSSSRREDLVARSQAFVAEHSWDASAKGYLAAFDHIKNRTR